MLKYSASRPCGTMWEYSERDSAWVPPSTKPISTASTKKGETLPAGRTKAQASTEIQTSREARITRLAP